MATDNDSLISTLNNLIETCKDGENGFRTASDGVKNQELKALFLTYSQQRAQFASELQAEVRRRARSWTVACKILWRFVKNPVGY